MRSVATQPPDICRPRHGGNPDSEAANRRVAPTKYEVRALLYNHILMQGSHGATCKEASNATGVGYTTCSARLSELKAEHWLVDTGERRKTPTGSSAAVLRAQTQEERDRQLRAGQQRNLFEVRA